MQNRFIEKINRRGWALYILGSGGSLLVIHYWDAEGITVFRVVVLFLLVGIWITIDVNFQFSRLRLDELEEKVQEIWYKVHGTQKEYDDEEDDDL